RSHFRSGKRRAGSTRKIPAAGSNGTAATLWADAAMTMSAKSNAGRQSNATSPRFAKTANVAISNAAAGNARRCCIGRMIRERFDRAKGEYLCPQNYGKVQHLMCSTATAE